MFGSLDRGSHVYRIHIFSSKYLTAADRKIFSCHCARTICEWTSQSKKKKKKHKPERNCPKRNTNKRIVWHDCLEHIFVSFRFVVIHTLTSFPFNFFFWKSMSRTNTEKCFTTIFLFYFFKQENVLFKIFTSISFIHFSVIFSVLLLMRQALVRATSVMSNFGTKKKNIETKRHIYIYSFIVFCSSSSVILGRIFHNVEISCCSRAHHINDLTIIIIFVTSIPTRN